MTAQVDFMGTPWLFVCENDFVKNVMFAKSNPFPRLLTGGGAILSVSRLRLAVVMSVV